jgi:hypothetical protein
VAQQTVSHAYTDSPFTLTGFKSFSEVQWETLAGKKVCREQTIDIEIPDEALFTAVVGPTTTTDLLVTDRIQFSLDIIPPNNQCLNGPNGVKILGAMQNWAGGYTLTEEYDLAINFTSPCQSYLTAPSEPTVFYVQQG